VSNHRDVTPENGGAACSVSESAFVYSIKKGEIVVGSCSMTRAGDSPLQIAPRDAICQGDIAGEMAKAGRLDIETPFASIRGGTRVGGLGILSLASLFFAATQDAQAAPSDTSFVDDDTIRPRDLTSDYGIIELTTRDGQTILLDSPEYTLVFRRGAGGAITYSQAANSPATMLSYEKDQAGAWHIFSLASGPAANGSNGSSTLFLKLPPPTPINFTIPPGQQGLNFTLQPPGGANSVLDNFVPLPEHQPPPPQPVVLTPPTIAIDETAGGENGALPISGVSVANAVSATLTVLNGSLHIDNGNLPPGVTITGDDTNDLMVSGDAPAVNTLLAGLTYTRTGPGDEGADTLTISVIGTDGTITTASTTITIDPLADPPTAAAPTMLSLAENTTVAVHGVSVGPLAEDSDDTVNATLKVTHGTLHVNNSGLPSGVTVTGDDSNDLMVSGDAAKVNALLADLKYTPITEYEGPDTLNLSVTSTDGNNTFLTPASTSTSILVEGVADTPIITVTTPSFTADEDNPIAVTGLSVSPAENNANDEADTFTAVLYVDRGTLTVGNRSGATISGGNGHTLAHSIVISGSLSEVNAALATVHYTPSPTDETPDTLHISATTTEESAVGGDTSAPATDTVSIRESDVPAPAEVAGGGPLNLALTDPSDAPGRSGDETLTGGSSDDTFVFKAIVNSQPGISHFDTITHFVHNSNHIDPSAIAGATLVEGPVTIADTIAANTRWFVDSAHNQRIIEINTTATADHIDLEIYLTGSNINLSGADILHHT